MSRWNAQLCLEEALYPLELTDVGVFPLLGEGNDKAQVAGQLVCRTQRFEYLRNQLF